MINFILKFVLSGLGLLAIAHYVPGIEVESIATAIIAAAVFAILNVTVRPVLLILTLPITIITLGLFVFVINAFLFWFVAGFFALFVVDGFVPALIGAIAYSILTWLIDKLI